MQRKIIGLCRQLAVWPGEQQRVVNQFVKRGHIRVQLRLAQRRFQLSNGCFSHQDAETRWLDANFDCNIAAILIFSR